MGWGTNVCMCVFLEHQAPSFLKSHLPLSPCYWPVPPRYQPGALELFETIANVFTESINYQLEHHISQTCFIILCWFAKFASTFLFSITLEKGLWKWRIWKISSLSLFRPSYYMLPPSDEQGYFIHFFWLISQKSFRMPLPSFDFAICSRQLEKH